MKHLYLILLFFSTFSFSQVQLLKNISIGDPNSSNGEYIIGAPENSVIVPGIELNGFYYFALFQGDAPFEGYSLYKTYGTEANTIKIKAYPNTTNSFSNRNVIINQSIIIDDFFYFKEGPQSGNDTNQIWRSDGTEIGTEIVVGQSNPSQSEMILLNNNIIYTDFTPDFGRELYIIPNGLPTTLQVLKDIRPGNTGGTSSVGFSSDAKKLNKLGNSIIFVADDGVTDEELWITDGTEVGTQLLKDIRPTSGSNPRGFIAFNNKLYFFANNGISYGFWETDGTTEGTILIKENLFSNEDYQGIVYNNKMYFGAETSSTGIEIWTSDGTNAGTQLLKDINPNESDSKPNSFSIANDLLFFIAETDNEDEELWVTDGTSANTLALTSFINDNAFANVMIFDQPSKLFSDGDNVYYLANYATDNTLSNNEIGISSGTLESTNMLAEINPNGNALFVNPFIINDKLVFESFEGTYYRELWTSELSQLSNDENKFENSNISLYPNPSIDYISVKNLKNRITEITIFSLEGRKIKTFTSNFQSISVQDLSAGTYVVSIELDNGQLHKLKFIKQ
ncbi:T9SS type A sorting domain-containing protein [Psychroserpens sp.]|uniref:T9SS type A sorting domain-containing protein n=1 Tax=Psychroserpens sp. TaxID=2020870 RepID=UPI003C7318CC